MSNIEEDVELVKRYLENSSYKESESNFFKNGGWEMVDLEIPKAMANILAEREQMIEEREKYTIHLTDEEYRKVIENAQKDVANDSIIAHKFAVMQQQLDEKDKRIQELEKENAELLELKISVSSMNTIQNLEKEKIKLEERCFMAEGNLKTTKKELRDYFYNSIPKQAVIDLKNNITLDNTIVGGRRNGKTLEYGIKLGKIKACEELLGGGK